MNGEPIKAAELVRKARSGLSRYRLVGMAWTSSDGIAKLRMTDVRTINGVQVSPRQR